MKLFKTYPSKSTLNFDRFSPLAALAIGAAAGIVYLYFFPPGPPIFHDLDSGYYYETARHSIQPAALMYAIRPLIPFLVYVSGLPAPLGFAGLHFASLCLLTVLVERLGRELDRPFWVRLAGCVVVCAAAPVWSAFWVRAMIDIPILCLITSVMLLVLKNKTMAAVALSAISSLAHTLGFFISLGLLFAKSKWRAVLAASLGLILLGAYLLLFRRVVLGFTPQAAFGFFKQGTRPFHSIVTQTIYGIGPLLPAIWFVPRSYRRLLFGASVGLMLGLIAGAWGFRVVGYLCPLFAPGAMPKVPESKGDFHRVFRCVMLTLHFAATVVLFLLPLGVDFFQPPSKILGFPLFAIAFVSPCAVRIVEAGSLRHAFK